MKKEDLDDIIKEGTKLLLESEWENAIKEGHELVQLQEKMFSPMFNSIIHQAHTTLSKEEVVKVLNLISNFTKDTNNEHFNVLICFLTYMSAECLRLSPLYQEGGLQ
jgi:hypothetical protein